MLVVGGAVSLLEFDNLSMVSCRAAAEGRVMAFMVFLGRVKW